MIGLTLLLEPSVEVVGQSITKIFLQLLGDPCNLIMLELVIFLMRNKNKIKNYFSEPYKMSINIYRYPNLIFILKINYNVTSRDKFLGVGQYYILLLLFIMAFYDLCIESQVSWPYEFDMLLYKKLELWNREIWNPNAEYLVLHILKS